MDIQSPRSPQEWLANSIRSGFGYTQIEYSGPQPYWWNLFTDLFFLDPVWGKSLNHRTDTHIFDYLITPYLPPLTREEFNENYPATLVQPRLLARYAWELAQLRDPYYCWIVNRINAKNSILRKAICKMFPIKPLQVIIKTLRERQWHVSRMRKYDEKRVNIIIAQTIMHLNLRRRFHQQLWANLSLMDRILVYGQFDELPHIPGLINRHLYLACQLIVAGDGLEFARRLGIEIKIPYYGPGF